MVSECAIAYFIVDKCVQHQLYGIDLMKVEGTFNAIVIDSHHIMEMNGFEHEIMLGTANIFVLVELLLILKHL